MSKPYYQNVKTGIFRRRMNRFVVECELAGAVVRAHLPNTGRLWGLLLPGRPVYVIANGGQEKRTQFTVVGTEQDGMPVLLDTLRCNDVAETLIREGRIAELRGWKIAKREAVFGNSRFDFLLERDEQFYILEVKCCTQFAGSIAMFPDAVTERGSKHLAELVHLSHSGYRAGVLFLIQWEPTRYFLPDYHTDLVFSRQLYEYRHALSIIAVALSWQSDFSLGLPPAAVAIPWNLIGREANDCGYYIFILRLSADRNIVVGNKGSMCFSQGYYLYVGSARKHLTKRLERHGRKRKKFHWHIDYLRQFCTVHAALAIRTEDLLEHDIAVSLAEIADWSIPGFGCSDCHCASHLFGMNEDPLTVAAFIELVKNYRLQRLENKLASSCEGLALSGNGSSNGSADSGTVLA